ncbi:MAG: ABC transporter substrate-binding protein [Oscillospiraceae bacterium]
MKKIIASIMAIVTVATVFVGCDGSNSVDKEVVPFPVSVNNVTIEKAPKAVASLSPVLTNILTDLGYTSKIVGYSDGEVLPEIPPPPPVESEPEGFRWFWEKKAEPVSTEPEPELPKGEIGTALKPNFEKIGEYLPEIIFTTVPVTKAQMEKLDAVKIKLIVIPAAKTIEELKTNYLLIIKAMSGQLVADARGATLVLEMQKKIDYIASVVPEPKLTYLYVASIDPMIATGDTYESSLISTVATNLAGEFNSYTLTAEQLAELEPDIILYSFELNKENIVQSEQFKTKKAVTEDRLIPIDKGLLLNQTQGAAESIREIAKLIYPSVDFSQPVPLTSSDQEKK